MGLFKKYHRAIAAICTAACALTSLQLCPVNSSTASAAVKFKVASKKICLFEGTKKKIKYSAPKKIKITSSNKKIVKAAVSGKKIVIKGVKKGTAKITVKCQKKKIKINVTVKKITKAAGLPANISTAAPTLYPSATPTLDPQTAYNFAKSAAEYSSPGNKFTYQVFNNVKKSGNNTFISPFSIYTALVMLANGADGNTRTQLLNTLGITNLNDANIKFGNYLKGGLDDKVSVGVANSFWITPNIQLSPNIDNSFITPLKQYYNADVYKNFNFTSPEALGTMNSWVSNKTNGLIPSAFDNVSQYIFALVNTVYFKGRWSESFMPDNTIVDTFHGTNGDTTVNMMQKQKYISSYKPHSYYKDNLFTGLSMNYGSGRYTMDVLMSTDESKNTGDLWSSLSTDEQINVIASLDAKSTQRLIHLIKFPKFNLEYTASNLNETLIGLGLTDMYDYSKANLSNISPFLYVDNVMHKTAIKVDEEGTEAAAVTVVSHEVSAITDNGPDIDFIVNRPFVFFIRDKVSGIILFIGEVNNI